MTDFPNFEIILALFLYMYIYVCMNIYLYMYICNIYVYKYINTDKYLQKPHFKAAFRLMSLKTSQL